MAHTCFAHILTLFLLVSLPTVTMAAETPKPPEKWTPENAVVFALANNPDTAITRQRIAAAEAAVHQANSAFYPRLDLNASYRRTNNPMYSFGNILNQGVFDDTIDFNDPGTSDNLNMTATISYNLYKGGHDLAGREAAEADKTASLFEMDAVRSQLAFGVVQAFFTIIQAEETVQARQSAVDAITASLQVAKARYEEGDLLKADLLNLEVHDSEARENLIQARHGYELAKRGFLNLLGLEKGVVNIAPDCSIEQLIPGDLSYVTRAELRQIETAIDGYEARVSQARSSYYPAADAFASYQVDEGYELDGSGDSWLAGIRISYNVFAGGQTESRVAGTQARLAELREQQRKLSLAISLEVQQAKLAMEQTEQRLQVTEKMVEQAEESAKINRERFKEGLLLSSELIDVENRLTEANVRRTLARAAYRIAVADLRRAVGLGQFNTLPQASDMEPGTESSPRHN